MTEPRTRQDAEVLMLRQEVERLRAENGELRDDAERYRWMRGPRWWTARDIMGNDPYSVNRWSALDARIDAARAALGAEK